MDPAAPLAGVKLPKRQEPITFQFTPIHGANCPKYALYAVLNIEGQLSWVKPPTMAVKNGLTYNNEEVEGNDLSVITTSGTLTRQVSKFDLSIKLEGISRPQALALSNLKAGFVPYIKNGLSYKYDSDFPVRAPTEITGIFSARPNGNIQCRLYILKGKGAVLHTVDDFSAFRPAAGSDSFPKFSRLPAEIRDMIWKLAMPGKRPVRMRAAIPHEGGPAWLFKSYATSIPGIIQACSESRSLAMEILTPAFESTDAAYAGLVTYFNFAVDTLAVPFNTARWMADDDDINVVAARAKVRNILCYANTFRLADWIIDIFTLFVFAGALRAWPKVESWSFPGVKKEEIRLARYTSWVCLEFRQPRTIEEAGRCVYLAKKRIKKALEYARPNMTRSTVVGLRIRFVDNPYAWRHELLHKDISPLDW